jgi:6-phosphogluconolactonase
MPRNAHRFSTGRLAAQARPDSRAARAMGIPWWIYVGTHTGGESKGIYLFQMKTSENPDMPEYVTMTPLGLVAQTPNPSFIAVDPQRRTLYCVNDTESTGAVSAFSIDPGSGKLAFLNQRSSMGTRPCHLALDGSGRHLVVANHGGSLAVLPVAPDGKLGEATDLRRHAGKTHVQGVAFSPDRRFVFACDSGLDVVMAYRLDPGTGKLAPHDPASVTVKSGAGPRRLVFHPGGKFAYVVGELDSTVTAFAYDAKAGTFQNLQALSTLPGYFDGPNRAAELAVHPNGKYLYASNCGHDSVVLFSIDAARGTLTYVEDQSTYGTMPVHFGMDTPGQHLAVANNGSGTILILRAPESGRVKPGGNAVKLPGAACAVFVSPPGR